MNASFNLSRSTRLIATCWWKFYFLTILDCSMTLMIHNSFILATKLFCTFIVKIWTIYAASQRNPWWWLISKIIKMQTVFTLIIHTYKSFILTQKKRQRSDYLTSTYNIMEYWKTLHLDPWKVKGRLIFTIFLVFFAARQVLFPSLTKAWNFLRRSTLNDCLVENENYATD